MTKPVYLTTREDEAFRLLVQGHSNRQTAELMGVSIKTVEKHRLAIYYKWGVDSLAAMTRVALRQKIITLEQLLASEVGEHVKHQPPPHLESKEHIQRLKALNLYT
jgi:DNA-binding CsgD family transcriptional regulator